MSYPILHSKVRCDRTCGHADHQKSSFTEPHNVTMHPRGSRPEAFEEVEEGAPDEVIHRDWEMTWCLDRLGDQIRNTLASKLGQMAFETLDATELNSELIFAS